MYVLGLSAVAITGVFGLLVAIVSGASLVTVSLVGREAKTQNEQAVATVSEFEAAWKERGRLLKGYIDDNEILHGRIDELEVRLQKAEQRERACFEGFEHLLARQAVLEERLGVKSGDAESGLTEPPGDGTSQENGDDHSN